jgi:hypothetical protein
MGDLRHVPLHKPPLGDFAAVSRDRETTPWWLPIGGERLRLYLIFSKIRMVSHVASQLFAWRTWSCHMDIPAHHIGQTHTSCTYLCGNEQEHTALIEQDVEDPCVGMSQV